MEKRKRYKLPCENIKIEREENGKKLWMKKKETKSLNEEN